MTQDEKQILLQDLCARQMHNVKCRVKYSFNNETTDGRDVWTEDDDIIRMINSEYEEAFISSLSEWVDIENVKPYLRPMSSMTEEEKFWFNSLRNALAYQENGEYDLDDFNELQDFLNRNHFDYRGLIEKGFALEAPKTCIK